MPTKRAALALLVASGLFGLGLATGAELSAHRTITAPDLPIAQTAPYSQGVMAGDLLFLSGNIGQDPATGKVPAAFADEARQALDNLGRILKAAGLGWPDVVKVNVYVKDMSRYAEFNALYTSVLPAPYPARTFLAVADIPGGGQIEIEAIAIRRK
jgi:2-iminobutanoate/2-iminopropanoate deaminase